MISEPKVTIQIIPAAQFATVSAQKVLVIGQMISGTATATVLEQEIGNSSNENALFGRKSHIAGMIRRFKKVNKQSQLDALPLADVPATAVKGTSIIEFAGTATEDGTYYVSVCSKKDHKYKVDVTSGDTAEEIATTLLALSNADADAPFTGGSATAVITYTAANGGTLCNNWGIESEGQVAGITVTVTGWTGGANDPTLASILDVIANIRYQTIIIPSAYVLDVFGTELATRWNTANAIKDGVGVQVLDDTLANLKTATSSLNNQVLVVFGEKAISRTLKKGATILEMQDHLAAEFAAIESLRFIPGASVSDYITTTSPTDQFGGMHMGSLPYFNTKMPYSSVSPQIDEFSEEDLNELTDNAVAVLGANRARNATIMGTVVTTYLTDGAGNPDTSYKYLNTVRTASLIREYFFENIKSKFSQYRLTSGDLISGASIANLSSIRAYFKQLYINLSEELLVVAGNVAIKDFDDNLVITADYSSGTITYSIAPLLVSQIRVFLGTQQVKFAN